MPRRRVRPIQRPPGGRSVHAVNGNRSLPGGEVARVDAVHQVAGDLAGDLGHDDSLRPAAAPVHDVLLVSLVELLGAQGVAEVEHHWRVTVEIVTGLEQTFPVEHPLHLLPAFIGQVRGALLEL